MSDEDKSRRQREKWAVCCTWFIGVAFVIAVVIYASSP